MVDKDNLVATASSQELAVQVRATSSQVYSRPKPCQTVVQWSLSFQAKTMKVPHTAHTTSMGLES